MQFVVEYHPSFNKDMKKIGLSKKQKINVLDKIDFVSTNPYPKSKGGYGEPLVGNLTGLLKFRFDSDYRVVYKLEEIDGVMKVLVIGLRKDKEVYREADRRK
ncbi:MAG: type II toxin-antitoxin system mRNA interferase toxin, RelE/StbE family [Acidaminobacteraceae bacterium]